MKKTLKVITAIVLLAVIVTALTGCSRSTTTPTTLEEIQNVTEKTVSVTIDPTVEVWVDKSASVTEADAKVLDTKADELLKQFPEAVGPYPFGGAATGSGTTDGWTDLVDPIHQSDSNAIVYILTDGWHTPAIGSSTADWIGPFHGRDIHFICIRKDANTEDLKAVLEENISSFQGSSVMLEYLDGAEGEVLIEDFTPATGTVTYEDSDTKYQLSSAGDDTPVKQGWPWWMWLLLALLLLALLALLLWWLLRRRRRVGHTGSTTPTSTPTTTVPTNTAAGQTATVSNGTPAVPENTVVPEGTTTTGTGAVPVAPTARCKCSCSCCCNQRNIAAIVAAIAAVAASVAAIATALVVVVAVLL